MPGINVYEFLILIVLALVILGPERLPQYAQTLAGWVRKARGMAEDAKVRFREETGTDFDAVDWHKYDPRQYDPRRIIREALADDYDQARAGVQNLQKSVDPRALFSSAPAAGSQRATAAGVAGAAAGTAGTEAGTADDEGADQDPLASAFAPFDSDAT
ncbi:hypothetical protein [Nesterenkonia massiliensis]|uniref:hypothetical protein n=1 Tax=Nesterenkonia massiliensis TaxID=1232429 RepID=UPI000425508F|nr:hypothetical protein [Nesterenkonia massiliensis]